mmetsp:Transcript_16815/g.33451  ORF Transcript_16815/g.33451 Transcript_16815/m.33451 type:complete len:138 (+) Transcript_16815:111-524(+)
MSFSLPLSLLPLLLTLSACVSFSPLIICVTIPNSILISSREHSTLQASDTHHINRLTIAIREQSASTTTTAASSTPLYSIRSLVYSFRFLRRRRSRCGYNLFHPLQTMIIQTPTRSNQRTRFDGVRWIDFDVIEHQN